MKKSLLVLLVVAMLLGACGATPTPQVIEKVVEKVVTAVPAPAPAVTPRSVVLVGFGYTNADGTWAGEIAPYMAALQDPVDVSAATPYCTGPLFTGTLSGEPVLLGVAGTAKVRMTACVENILQVYAPSGGIKEVILTAIAGITPMRGGMVDVENGFAPRKDDLAMIGDVCISSVAYDFDLQFFAMDKGGTWTPDPVFWASSWVGPSNMAQGSKALADELYAASLLAEWPEQSEMSTANNMRYHGESRKPKAWSQIESIEATDDLFWHGIREDYRARVMGAGVISSTLGIDVTAADIVICTSMEAVPSGAMVQWWNEIYGTSIPWAYIRGASNFDSPPLDANGFPAISGRESIESGFEAGGWEVALQAEAVPVLKMMELRSAP